MKSGETRQRSTSDIRQITLAEIRQPPAVVRRQGGREAGRGMEGEGEGALVRAK